MKKLLTLGLFFGTFAISYGQTESNYVAGEVLVQLSTGTDVELFLKENSAISLQNAQLVSKHVNIWRFEFDASQATIDQSIAVLYGNKSVVTAQRNHIITYRAEPDDPGYDNQWQYYQSNDRDIDADLAWDVTTGGATANGDRIVVCVIDDGINTEHPDLIPNLWTNEDEIAGNGIDDDGNGFVDDIDGWNAYTDDDNVGHTNWWEGHGSAVAGIVGAKGNDGVGVAGVNWDVDLMIVKGGGNEAEALAAYSYALENRKLYNSSNGEKGAFVVATNASWGVDYGNPDDAPLWCAMYDTLGHHGILNAGATINGNENVDVVGDLPTACPSDFLITVTNTNQSDNKVTSAGYGAVTIDLGAPGANAWTVASEADGSGYGGFGGTSGATPHVAGTIALLYSAPCLAFADLAKSNPQLAAEKVRDYILNGVDDNASLDGITTTGGRLNVNNAVQSLMLECSEAAGIDEQSSGFAFSVYPNPATSQIIYIKSEMNTDLLSEITLTDMSGKVVYNQTQSFGVENDVITLELPELSNGFYNLTITSNGSSWVEKIAIK